MPNATADIHDTRALEHYQALIDARYPPHLAAALAAARYQAGLLAGNHPPPLPVLREVVSAVKDGNPRLRRVAGQMLERVEAEMGLTRS